MSNLANFLVADHNPPPLPPRVPKRPLSSASGSVGSLAPGGNPILPLLSTPLLAGQKTPGSLSTSTISLRSKSEVGGTSDEVLLQRLNEDR